MPLTAENDKSYKIGTVTHYFSKIGVAVVELISTLDIGDTIHVKGATSDFVQPVDFMQIDHCSVQKASPPDIVAIKMADHVRVGDIIYKVDQQ
jgi:translation elongation factor EF-1alpha